MPPKAPSSDLASFGDPFDLNGLSATDLGKAAGRGANLILASMQSVCDRYAKETSIKKKKTLLLDFREGLSGTGIAPARVDNYMTTVNQVCLRNFQLLNQEPGKNAAKNRAVAAANTNEADEAGFAIISAVFATASSSPPQHHATYAFAQEVSDGFHIDRSDESIFASARAESVSAAGAEEQECNVVAHAADNVSETVPAHSSDGSGVEEEQHNVDAPATDNRAPCLFAIPSSSSAAMQPSRIANAEPRSAPIEALSSSSSSSSDSDAPYSSSDEAPLCRRVSLKRGFSAKKKRPSITITKVSTPSAGAAPPKKAAVEPKRAAAEPNTPQAAVAVSTYVPSQPSYSNTSYRTRIASCDPRPKYPTKNLVLQLLAVKECIDWNAGDNYVVNCTRERASSTGQCK